MESFSFSLYLGNPMDPPDVLGMEPGIARPTKLPNRAKSTPVLLLSSSSLSPFLEHLLNTNGFLPSRTTSSTATTTGCPAQEYVFLPSRKIDLCSSMLLSDVCRPCDQSLSTTRSWTTTMIARTWPPRRDPRGPGCCLASNCGRGKRLACVWPRARCRLSTSPTTASAPPHRHRLPTPSRTH